MRRLVYLVTPQDKMKLSKKDRVLKRKQSELPSNDTDVASTSWMPSRAEMDSLYDSETINFQTSSDPRNITLSRWGKYKVIITLVCLWENTLG